MGNRVYTATWISSDSVLNILERIQVLAQTHPYESELVAYLAGGGPAMDDPYKIIDPKVAQDAEDYLKKLIREDGTAGNYRPGEIGAYSDRIEIQIKSTKTDRRSDKQKQIYTFEVEAVYTDDAGERHPVTIANYQAQLQKMVAEKFIVPDIPKGTFGQKLNEITKGVTIGKSIALYTNMDLDYEQNASGTYSWKNADQIPFGRNNGTEENEYEVIFTPDSDCEEYFAPAETKASVLTQIGLYVTAAADSRVYRYNDKSTTGSAKLFYADEKGDATEKEFTDIEEFLSGGTWSFESAKAEPDKRVEYSGYTLDKSKNSNELYGEDAYVVVNATATSTAAITQVQQKDVTISNVGTEKSLYSYGTLMGDIHLAGSVKYRGEEVQGTWKWNRKVLEEKPDVGASHTAYFIADKKYEDGFEVFTAEVNIPLSYQNVYVPEIRTVYYNGKTQKPAFPNADSDGYIVHENNGGQDAGTYDVILRLKDTKNTVWMERRGNTENGLGQDDIIRKFNILKAVPQVTTGSVKAISYGQKLTSGDSKKETVNNVSNIQTMYSAKDMLAGFKVTYPSVSETESGNGIWSWVTEKNANGDELLLEKSGSGEKKVAQPLAVGKHSIKVKYTPGNNQNNLDSYEIYVEVTVQKTTPYVVGEMGDTIMYQGGNHTIANAEIKADSVKAYNPYIENEVLNGSWVWGDSTYIPMQSGENSVRFIPSDANTYTSDASKNCKVTIRNTIEIHYVIIAKNPTIGTGKVEDRTGILKDWNPSNNTFTIELKGTYDSGVFKSATIKWKNEGGAQIEKKISALNTDTNGIRVEQPDEKSFKFSFTDAKLPNDLSITLDARGNTRARSKIQAQIMEPETELSTETITESQTSSQDTESSEPETTTSNPAVPETTMTESPTTETTASETQTPETELPQTQVPETSAPETTAPQPETAAPQTEQPASETPAPQTEQPAAETPAPQTETATPETAAPQAETSAPPQPAETQAAEIQSAESMEPVQNNGDS